MTTGTHTPTTTKEHAMTIGDLTPNAIGRDRIIVQHEGSTVSGLLVGMDIDAQLITDARADGTTRCYVGPVRVAVTIGSIRIGPLNCTHPCEVIA